MAFSLRLVAATQPEEVRKEMTGLGFRLKDWN